MHMGRQGGGGEGRASECIWIKRGGTAGQVNAYG